MIECSVKNCLKAVNGTLIRGTDGQEFNGVSIDSRTVNEGALFVCIHGERFDGHDFIPEAVEKGVAGIMLSNPEKLSSTMNMENALSPFIIQVEDTLTALQELARFYREQSEIRVVGITGTNGKSTTKEMTASIAASKFATHKTKGNLNNHIGVPLTLLDMMKEDEVAILEMGMSATGEIKRLSEIAQPDIGIITNISEGHLIQLKTLKGVQKAKGELFEALAENGTAIVNADDPLVLELARSLRTKVVTFGIDNSADVHARNIRPAGNEGFDFTVHMFDEEVPIQLPFLGFCNIYNALAAMATGYSLGVPTKNMSAGLANSTLLAQRYEIIRQGEITIINDSYNANPKSMREALTTLQQFNTRGKKYFVIGEMRELGDLAKTAHVGLGQEVKKHNMDYLITVGEMAGLTAQSAREEGMEADRVYAAGSHKDAIDFMKKKSLPGDCFLIKGSRGAAMEEVVKGLVQH